MERNITNIPLRSSVEAQPIISPSGTRPSSFRKKFAKGSKLRVTVVGEKVFPAAIRSQESRSLRHDWRHYPHFGGSRYYSVYSLPAKIEKLCVRLVEALGICFGAIDLIVTPDDDYVFLEVNPNGQWAWIEDFTGLPISDAIAELLIRSAA
jgi:glutathione synthase/RimK-type ligase-like ATP-grasp enzyme